MFVKAANLFSAEKREVLRHRGSSAFMSEFIGDCQGDNINKTIFDPIISSLHARVMPHKFDPPTTAHIALKTCCGKILG